MGWLTVLRTALDAVVPFVDLADGALERRHERKQAKHQRELRLIEQGAAIRRGPLDEITFALIFYPWAAMWVPYAPVRQHAIETMALLGQMPEMLVWPALLILSRIWGASPGDIPKRLWKR